MSSPKTLRRRDGLRFALEADGRLRVEGALGADEVRIAPAVVRVLAAFAAARAPEEVARELAGGAAAARGAGAAGVRRAIDGLERAGLLVAGAPRGVHDPRAARDGIFADLDVHRRLLADVRRAERFGAAIARLAPGRRVVEVGAGTGVLAVLAARAGARSVLAIEETRVAALARALVRANGVEGVVRVVEAASRDVELAPAERGDVLVAELLGGDPLDERLLDAVADARERLLAPGARTIPRALEVIAQPLDARDDRCDAPRRLAELDEGARALAIDLGPVRDALAATGPPSFIAEVRELEAGGGARLLGPAARLFRFDLERGSPASLRRAAEGARATARLAIDRAGELAALAVFFRADLAEGIELSNAPLAPPTHWGQLVLPLPAPRAVRAGERVTVAVRAERGALSIVEDGRGARARRGARGRTGRDDGA